MGEAMGRYAEEHTLGLYRDRFTESQRRRVETLILVRYLFPGTHTGASQAEIAQWVATGRWLT